MRAPVKKGEDINGVRGANQSACGAWTVGGIQVPYFPFLTCLIGFSLGLLAAATFVATLQPSQQLPITRSVDVKQREEQTQTQTLLREPPSFPAYGVGPPVRKPSQGAVGQVASNSGAGSPPKPNDDDEMERGPALRGPAEADPASTWDSKTSPETRTTTIKVNVPEANKDVTRNPTPQNQQEVSGAGPMPAPPKSLKQPLERDYVDNGDETMTFCRNKELDAVGAPPESFKFMLDRFRYMKEDWKSAVGQFRDKVQRHGVSWTFSIESPLTQDVDKMKTTCSPKKILIYIGTFLIFRMDGLRGNPQGGLVQWTDLYAALVFLGYDVTLVEQKKEIQAWTKETWAQFDLVLTDYAGAHEIGLKQRPILEPRRVARRCKFRVLDTFGTQDEFNSRISEEANMFCCLHLDLRQYYTFIPDFAPENTFLGYAVPRCKNCGNRERKWQALIWGKHSKYFAGATNYLQIIQEYIPLMSTLPEKEARKIPNFIVNRGLQTPQGIHSLYEESAVLVGLGIPFNGPSGIEALTHGMAVINPRHVPFASSDNHPGMYEKPTRLGLTSQHPFLQHYVGPPWAYTVDIKNETELRSALKRLRSMYYDDTHPRTSLKSREGMVPYSYSLLGFLERVYLLVEYQSFCG